MGFVVSLSVPEIGYRDRLPEAVLRTTLLAAQVAVGRLEWVDDLRFSRSWWSREANRRPAPIVVRRSFAPSTDL